MFKEFDRKEAAYRLRTYRHLSKLPMDCYGDGSRSKPIRQALEEAKRLGRNVLSQVDGDPKDHEQNRQTDAAYPVSSFRESVQGALRTLLCLFQLGCSCISGESGTNQKYQTDPDHHKHFSKWDITILRPERAGSRQGRQHPC